MDRWNESLFRAAALASGLVTQEQMEEAISSLRAELEAAADRAVASAAEAAASAGTTPRGEAHPGKFAAPAATPEASGLTDDALAEKLIALGRLNRWQVEQLKAGRTKFQLGDYQIIDSIGQGGMGQVFKAVHTLHGRVEAVKVLPRARSTPSAIASFRHEIRAQAQLDHPNLVRVSYAGFDGNVYYLVTEYVPGTDLRQLVRSEGVLSMPMAATIVSQAAQALEYIHSRGLIHRDVKPGNILVTPEGLTKVSDMGLAGFTTNDADADPKAGKIVGTADYLAPEQILTPRAITPAVDIYSLGCTLYYAVTGKVPYPGGTAKDKARRHCNDTPLHPRHFNPDLTDEFVEVIADMMEKDATKRIATAAQVIERLAPWLGESTALVPAVQRTAPSAKPPVRRGSQPTVGPPPGSGAPRGDSDSEVFDFPQPAPTTESGTQSTERDAAAMQDTVADPADFIDVLPAETPPVSARVRRQDPIGPWIRRIGHGAAIGCRAAARQVVRGALLAGRGVRGFGRGVRGLGRGARRALRGTVRGIDRSTRRIAALPAPLLITLFVCSVIIAGVIAILLMSI